MKINGICHTALYTDAFEETIAFYQGVFQAENLGIFETDRRGVWLKIGDSILEVFEADALPDGHFKHICIETDDVDALYEKALNAGAAGQIFPKDVCLNMKETRNLRIAFIRGINGEQIELMCSRDPM